MLLTTMAIATCFELVGPKYSYLPKELCVDSLALNIEQGVLYIDSNSMPESMAAEMIRKTEDLWSFKGSRELFEVDQGICSHYSRGVLSLSGDADIMGSINAEDLTVVVDVEYTNDTCHSPTREIKANYKLKN